MFIFNIPTGKIRAFRMFTHLGNLLKYLYFLLQKQKRTKKGFPSCIFSWAFQFACQRRVAFIQPWITFIVSALSAPSSHLTRKRSVYFTIYHFTLGHKIWMRKGCMGFEIRRALTTNTDNYWHLLTEKILINQKRCRSKISFVYY